MGVDDSFYGVWSVCSRTGLHSNVAPPSQRATELGLTIECAGHVHSPVVVVVGGGGGGSGDSRKLGYPQRSDVYR